MRLNDVLETNGIGYYRWPQQILLDVVDIGFAAGPFDDPSQDLEAQIRIDIGCTGLGIERLGELPSDDVRGCGWTLKAQLPGNATALKDGFSAGRTGSPAAAMIQDIEASCPRALIMPPTAIIGA